ncbi:energy transducer TonB [Candidatus Methylopumilus universalis]|uniref:energy transducer TonB n=1 Tax=Candidatus Methylopumilus universalis TaxID=2588536 RepID=UPI0011233482|nr:energy transducer TonB [Candidatus Methylopumilus universalis]QDC45494.1 energy transducer TonB [Candidatus Methylopumilus universalis]
MSRKLPFYFDLPKAIAISMAIHIILMIGLPELNKPLLIPQEMSVTISSSPIQQPIEKIETPQPVKKVEPIQKKITPIIDKNAISVAQPTPKEVAPASPAETVSKIPNIVPQEQLTQYLESYSSLLANAIAKYKQYPKIAQMRGWQGTVIADLEIDSKGTVISIKIKKSSTYEVLDNEALEMIRKASPFPAPPESLRGKNFNVLVPISFKLE